MAIAPYLNFDITLEAKSSKVRKASWSVEPPKLICIDGSIAPKASTQPRI